MPNLTPEENFRVHGTVPAHQIPELLDAHSQLEAIYDSNAELDKIAELIPEEGFLDGAIGDLEYVATLLAEEDAEAGKILAQALRELKLLSISETKNRNAAMKKLAKLSELFTE